MWVLAQQHIAEQSIAEVRNGEETLVEVAGDNFRQWQTLCSPTLGNAEVLSIVFSFGRRIDEYEAVRCAQRAKWNVLLCNSDTKEMSEAGIAGDGMPRASGG